MADETQAAPVSKSQIILDMATEASTCPACDLSETRTKVVFGDGNADSPLMLIGEGPGANEDATGLPFVGRAGKLLDECLREAGMLPKKPAKSRTGRLAPMKLRPAFRSGLTSRSQLFSHW